MDTKVFRQLFCNHCKKLAEAWVKLSDQDLKQIDGDLKKFLQCVSELYKIPEGVILKELDAVKQNIDEGIEADFAPRLDPRE